MNVSYTTLNSIWDQVRATDIHMVADEETEMCLIVNVISYPNKIFSVWIYFGILKK